jgi:ribose-phosphate pyrophosphokinase
MIEAVRMLKAKGTQAPLCIAVHALFAGDAFPKLLEAGPAIVISTNTVVHGSNTIDVSAVIAEAIHRSLAIPLASQRIGAAHYPTSSDLDA